MKPWILDPLERARTLDGELDPAEAARRERDLAEDPAGRALVERDARLVRAIRSTAALDEAPSERFEIRLRRALVADRRAWRLRRLAPWASAAAAVAAGALLWLTAGRVPTSEAAPREVLLAAETFRQAAMNGVHAGPGAAGSCEEGVASPHRFPLVTNGEASVETCEPGETETVSVLRREDDPKTPRGLVAIPWDGKSSATDVGWTRVGDVVVFDVAIGRAKYYLATRWDAVAGTPSCAACHGPQRANNPTRNPHRFVERQPVIIEPAK